MFRDCHCESILPEGKEAKQSLPQVKKIDEIATPAPAHRSASARRRVAPTIIGLLAMTDGMFLIFEI